MKISLKQMQKALIGHVLVLGLAACSSAPAPWVQSNDSPWKSKRSAEASSAPADEFVEVQSAPAAEPATAWEEPASAPEPEPVVVKEPEPEPMAEPEMAATSSGMDIMSAPASGFAVQVYAASSEDSVARYQSTHGLESLVSVKTQRDGSMVYVLVSLHDDRASANQAASEIEQKTGSKPWVRSISGLQQIAVQ